MFGLGAIDKFHEKGKPGGIKDNITLDAFIIMFQQARKLFAKIRSDSLESHPEREISLTTQDTIVSDYFESYFHKYPLSYQDRVNIAAQRNASLQERRKRNRTNLRQRQNPSS